MTRRLPALLLAGTAVVALTGCGNLEKPVPLVTLFSGGEVVKADASQWCFDVQRTGDGDCRIDDQTDPVLEVRPGDIVTISVDKELADRRWTYVQALASDPERSESAGVKDDHALSFIAPGVDEDVRLRIFALQGKDSGAQNGSGYFDFVLRPKL